MAFPKHVGTGFSLSGGTGFSLSPSSEALLSFWAFGDLHYRAWDQWLPLHEPRLALLFEDVQAVWQAEGKPAFVVSPGDLVDRGGQVNYELVKQELAEHLGDIPLYPGIGNHEYQPENENDEPHSSREFEQHWGRPVRYSWPTGDDVVCIMLDQPDPFLPGERQESPHVVFSQEALTFLDATLTQHAERIAVIFAHCPLHNTVLDRDPKRNLDADSLDPFFFVENSDEVRSLLARHRNSALYISGHTHSGWGSPRLIFTEQLGGHPFTHVNLMSPWYTGRGAGPRYNSALGQWEYRPDSPDVLATFAIAIYRESAVIRVREHRARQWIGRWEVPIAVPGSKRD